MEGRRTGRGGRKPQASETGAVFSDKRNTLTTRLTDDARKKLEAAAARNGRSLSQEAEARLTATFMADDMLSLLFGSIRLEEALILRRYFEAIKAATAVGGDDPGRWMFYAREVPFAFDVHQWGRGIAAGGMDASFDVDTMAAAVRRQVEENILGKALAEIAAHGLPMFGTDQETVWRLHSFTRACACLFRLSLSEDEREPYAPIYEAAAAWAAEHKAALTPFERERHAPILELAASNEEWLMERHLATA